MSHASFVWKSWHWFLRVPWLLRNTSVTLISKLRPQIFRHFEQFEKHSYLMFWLNRAGAFCETWESGRGRSQTAMMRSLWLLAKGWRYSNQLKILTLSTRSSWTVWQTEMTLIYTDASPHAERVSYSYFWPLTLSSAAILNFMKNA